MLWLILYLKSSTKKQKKDINEEMKLAAAHAIASFITDEEVSPDYCISGAFDKRVAAYVASRVARAAMDTNVARIKIDPEKLKEEILK
ncbi:MAG: hypothetical protein PWQ68_1904 [Thermoanaerobacteraceae bacterium]|nr:hypothetical protein [Thermoanaerobacteraceae bacterium]